MNVVIASDSFKGSMTSIEAGSGAAEGIRRVYPDAQIIVRPLADGGEGTVDALVSGCGGEMHSLTVTGPLGEKTTAKYGITAPDKTAVIETAQACGITLVDRSRLNPLAATTYGVGEIIKDAVKNGCRSFIIGLGGSATNDGGAGMLQALGFELLDKNGRQIGHGAEGLRDLVSISNKNAVSGLESCTFSAACDVTNPLCGKNGCSNVFAPQKGACKEMIPVMDKWLMSYASVSKKINPAADENYPGAGAAGGLGFALRTFLHADLMPGTDIILNKTGLEEYIKKADIVVTGEGRLDSQTVMGKAPAGVAAIAKKYSKPVIALCGCAADDANVCNNKGIDAFFPIIKSAVTIEEAMDPQNALRNMSDTAEQIFRLIRTFNLSTQ